MTQKEPTMGIEDKKHEISRLLFANGMSDTKSLFCSNKIMDIVEQELTTAKQEQKKEDADLVKKFDYGQYNSRIVSLLGTIADAIRKGGGE